MSKAKEIISNLSEAQPKPTFSPEVVEQVKQILAEYDVKTELEHGAWWQVNGGIAGEGMSDDAFIRLGTTRGKFCIHTTSSHYSYTEGMRSMNRFKDVMECLGKLHDLHAGLVHW